MIFKRLYFLVPPIIYLIIYQPSIYYGSAWGDDILVIGSYATDFNLMLKTFYDPSSLAGGYHYMPFFYFQCFLINTLFGDNAFPFGFHLYQYIGEAVVCFIGTVLFYQITNNKLASVLLVSLWVVHPINVQGFTRLLIGPAGVPATVFGFASAICLLKLKKIDNDKLKYILLICSSIFLLISFLSAEVLFLFPLIVLFICFCFDGRNIFTTKYLHIIFPIAFAYLIYFVLRFFVSIEGLFDPKHELLSWTQFGSLQDVLFRVFWLAPQLIIHYFKLIFYPFGLVDSAAEWYKVGESLFSPYVLFCQIVVFSLIISTLLLRKKLPLFSIGMAWFFITFVLVIQIIPLFSIVALRYCSLPALGLLLALFGILSLFEKVKFRKVLILLLVPVFVFLTYRTIYYLPSSKDFLLQYIYCAKEAPVWNRIQYLSAAYGQATKESRKDELPEWINKASFDRAGIQWLHKYLHINQGLSIEYGPMQMMFNYKVFEIIFRYLYSNGEVEKLKAAFNSAIVVKNDYIGWYTTAIFFKSIGQWQEAWENLKVAINKKLNASNLYTEDFIDIAKKANKFSEAEKLIENYIKLRDPFAMPYLFAGEFYRSFDKTDEALKYYKLGISKEQKPTNRTLYYINATNMFIKNMMFEEAKQSLLIYLHFNPQDKDAAKKYHILEKL